MKMRIIVALALAGTAWGVAQTFSNLQPDKLVGTWEAVTLHNGVPALCVYQMAFSAPADARLVMMRPKIQMFIGELTSSRLKDGDITLQFSMIEGRGENRYQRVEIVGRARSVDEDGYIDGKITLYDFAGHGATEAVSFRNKVWVQEFPDVSKAAQQALQRW